MQTYRGGRAITQACERAIELLKSNAAVVLECTPDDVEYDGQHCFLKSVPDKRLTVGSLARGYMYQNGLTVGVPVQATGSYRVQGVTEPDPETGMGNAAGSWTFGVQAADVRIEKATGKVEILHFSSAFDPGRVVNPQLCRGQITGGVVQGIGHALHEKIQFDDKGVIRGANFGPYHIPTVKDIPEKQTVTFVETPNPEGPFSAKPIAEHPIVVVPGVLLNALFDATGVEFTHVPVTPKDILEALKGRR
jgi:CO/xanthine dehydrogenase Mo-binding subunit